MPCVLVPDPPLPQRCGAAARTGLVLAPLAMALAGLTTVDVGQPPVARKSGSRLAAGGHSAECLVAQAVFAGAQVAPSEQRSED